MIKYTNFSTCAVAIQWLVCMQVIAMQTSQWISNPQVEIFAIRAWWDTIGARIFSCAENMVEYVHITGSECSFL